MFRRPARLAIILLGARVLAASIGDGADERITPVGRVNIYPATRVLDDPPASAAASATPPAPLPPGPAAPGKAVYESVCMICHGAGVAGAPRLGDRQAWAPRLAGGLKVLRTHALRGFTGKTGIMPARGGSPALPDSAIAAAVDYMVAQIGGALPAAAGETSGDVQGTAETPRNLAIAAPVLGTVAAANADQGKLIFESACAVCHTTGIGGAPGFGDRDAWAPRIAQGQEALRKHAIEGYMGMTLMPPKGGRPDLSEEDVRSAVAYLLRAVQ